MKLLHVSDTHGELFKLVGDAEAVVHTGDFFPNSSRGIVALERSYQERWLDNVMPNIKAWLGGRPFIFCPGNHDFHDPVPQMRAAGLNAISIDRQLVEFGGVRFFGLPYVKWFGGAWNHELSEPELTRMYKLLVGELLEVGAIDVLVSHAPMYGVLDRVGEERTGSIALRTLMQECRTPPSHLLVGHIHEQGGRRLLWSRGLIVSNAARTQRIIEVKT